MSEALILHDEKTEKYQKQMAELRRLLQSKPGKKDVKERQRVQYIPVGIIEDKLDKIFGDMFWQVHSLEYRQIFNELAVSLVLEVRHPITGEWIKRTGVGAAQIRIRKDPTGNGGLDPARKIQNAIEMDLPHAKANAFKNAALSLGKFFGRDLRRKDDESGYYWEYEQKQAKQAAFTEAFHEIEAATTAEEVRELAKKHEIYMDNADFAALVTKRFNELGGGE